MVETSASEEGELSNDPESISVFGSDGNINGDANSDQRIIQQTLPEAVPLKNKCDDDTRSGNDIIETPAVHSSELQPEPIDSDSNRRENNNTNNNNDIVNNDGDNNSGSMLRKSIVIEPDEVIPILIHPSHNRGNGGDTEGNHPTASYPT